MKYKIQQTKVQKHKRKIKQEFLKIKKTESADVVRNIIKINNYKIGGKYYEKFKRKCI